MTRITLRPDLKTPGGEIHDILLNGRYAGNMTLVFSQGHRIGGAVQLDRSSLSGEDKEEVVRFVRQYVQDLIMALHAADCDVIVTNSEYDHIISTNRDESGFLKEMDDARQDDLFADEDVGDDEADFEAVMDGGQEDDYITFGDEDASNADRIEMGRAVYYELVVVGESRNRVEYHVYGQDEQWIAEAFFEIRGTDGYGDIHFMFLPGEDEIEAVTDLVVSDFDEEAIDTFNIRIMYEGSEIEHIELTHEDLLDTPSYSIGGNAEGDYSVSLARDDGDILTYEIYDRKRGALPIGTATVDIGNRQLSGFIDFREPSDEEERETVAMLLMRELDKEKEYQALNLSVMHGNEKVDEFMFETDAVH